MHNFGILLKSYDGDFDLAERLIESFNKFNPESLPMFIVVHLCVRTEPPI